MIQRDVVKQAHSDTFSTYRHDVLLKHPQYFLLTSVMSTFCTAPASMCMPRYFILRYKTSFLSKRDIIIHVY